MYRGQKKIDLFINGEYICSSTRYQHCRDFKGKVLREGKVTYASIPKEKTVFLKLGDKVTCHYAK